MLQIRLLGGFEAYSDGKPLPGLGPQLRRLLAFLTLEANRTLEVEKLCQDLWPETEGSDALRTNVRRLRDALGDECGRLKTERGTISFHTEGAEIDVFQFTELAEQGNMEALRQAVKLYRGKLLEDWEDKWVIERREDLEIVYLDALKELASHALTQKDYLRATFYLQRFVYGCPNMNWGWEKLIETHLLSGNQDKVAEVYKHYVDHLRRRSQESKTHIDPSPRIDELVRNNSRQLQTSAIAQIQADAPTQTRVLPPDVPDYEAVGGAVPIGSPFYIERPEESAVYTALTQTGSTILIKGPRQIGKTSLLARALHHARRNGRQVILSDWQSLAHSDLESPEAFFFSLADSFAHQLGLQVSPEAMFQSRRSPGANFERFLHQAVFPAVKQPIVWGIDEADRLFPCAFRDDVFGRLRAWHNERALNPDSPWTTFSLLLAYSTEASLFIQNLHQSPFNVGTRVTLQDMTREQVAKLNHLYGDPLKEESEIERLYQLVGGHPYLARRSLQAIQEQRLDIAAIESQSDRDDSLFSEHLERIHFALRMDNELTLTVRNLLNGEGAPSRENFVRLCAAGIMIGSSPTDMRPRCRLYECFLRRRLL